MTRRQLITAATATLAAPALASSSFTQPKTRALHGTKPQLYICVLRYLSTSEGYDIATAICKNKRVLTYARWLVDADNENITPAPIDFSEFTDRIPPGPVFNQTEHASILRDIHHYVESQKRLVTLLRTTHVSHKAVS